MKLTNPYDVDEVLELPTNSFLTNGSTVGYGDRFPKYTGTNLEIHLNNDACGINHAIREAACAYDYTELGETSREGIKQFLEILQTAGLHPMKDYTRVYRDLGRGTTTTYPDHWLYVWANEQLMVATTTNPLTGNGMSENHCGSKGTPSHIAIEGKQQAVEKTVAQVDKLVHQSKGKEEGRAFV